MQDHPEGVQVGRDRDGLAGKLFGGGIGGGGGGGGGGGVGGGCGVPWTVVRAGRERQGILFLGVGLMSREECLDLCLVLRLDSSGLLVTSSTAWSRACWLSWPIAERPLVTLTHSGCEGLLLHQLDKRRGRGLGLALQ